MSGDDQALRSVLVSLAEVREQLGTLQLQMADLTEHEAKRGYLPRPSVRFWLELGEQELAAEIGKIRAWYHQIAIPWLGAPKLKPCTFTTEHGDALTTLDTASELWASLWLPERRTPALVASQGEFLARMWPGLLDILVRSTRSCEHQRAASNGHAAVTR